MKIEYTDPETPVSPRERTKAKARRPYRFHLNDEELAAASQLGDAPALAYAVIRAAAWGPRESEWVMVVSRASAALGRGYRWWYSATTKLQAAGLLEVQRVRGREARYRVRPLGQSALVDAAYRDDCVTG